MPKRYFVELRDDGILRDWEHRGLRPHDPRHPVGGPQFDCAGERWRVVRVPWHAVVAFDAGTPDLLSAALSLAFDSRGVE